MPSRVSASPERRKYYGTDMATHIDAERAKFIVEKVRVAGCETMSHG